MSSKSARSFGGRALVAALLAALLGPSPARSGQDPPADPSELVNALLGGLLGFRPASEDELRSDVETIGGVPFLWSVPFDYMTRHEVTRYIDALLDDEYPAERARVDERTLRALDLLPAGTDLRAVRRQLLLENVVGFYDDRPGQRRLYTVSADRSLTPANQLVLAHELRHALQDQHISIHGLLGQEVSDFDDRRLALMSLLEGDATLVMERFLARRLGRESEGLAEGLALPAPEMPGTAPVLRDQMVVPYLAGLGFVRHLERQGGWAAIREAWRQPPRSTEQVLHPEKYVGGEEPRPVELEPGAEPPAGQLLTDGVLGEALVRTLLDGDEAGAAGWGGDRYAVWDVRGRTLLVWRSLWDSEHDRGEFRRALVGRFSRARTRSAALGPSPWSGFEGGGWHFAIADARGAVVLVSSDDRELLKASVARITVSAEAP
jgi:hypothetical protein